MTKMCAWDKKRIAQKFDQFKKIVCKPRFACARCGRVAARKKDVCKPLAIDD